MGIGAWVRKCSWKIIKLINILACMGPSHPSPFTELQNKNNYTNTILLNRHLHGPLFMNNECNMGLE